MTVQTFSQPSFTTQDAASYKANIDASIQVVAAFAKQFAPRESNPVGMKLIIEAGVLANGTAVAAYEISGIGAPSTNPRIDRVVIDATTGLYTRIVGTENTTPVAPTVPTGKILICKILYFVGQTFISNSDIVDERNWLLAPKPLRNAVTQLELGGPFTTADFKIGTLSTVITTSGNPVLLMFKVVVQKTGFNANGAVVIRRNGAPIGLEFIIPLTDQNFNYKMGSKIDEPPAGTHTYEFFWNVEHPGDVITTVTGSDLRFDRYISALEIF